MDGDSADGAPALRRIAGCPTRERGITREQLLVTAGVMAGIAVAALDSTVVGTAMPTIIGQLGGIEQYGWVFAAYLLTATTTVPVFSTLADVRGRKPIFLVGWRCSWAAPRSAACRSRC